MSEIHSQLAEVIAAKIKAGHVFSREMVSVAYYDVLGKRNSKEKRETSEIWIDGIFEKVSKNPRESISREIRSADEIADVIYASIVML